MPRGPSSTFLLSFGPQRQLFYFGSFTPVLRHERPDSPRLGILVRIDNTDTKKKKHHHWQVPLSEPLIQVVPFIAHRNYTSIIGPKSS